jgi:hypothetical protein
MKINGWQRIGIVASVAWMIGAYICTFNAEEKANAKHASMIIDNCIDAHKGQETGDNECLKQGEDYGIKAFPEERNEAALVASVPVPLGWGFLYLVLFLVRWIKRGFV